MNRRTLRLLAMAVATGVMVAVAGVAWLLSRPGVSARSEANALVTIECEAATGASSAACRAWGDAILVADPAPNTFEREDLRRVTIGRSLLGFGGCSVAFFISRYEEPVWSGAVPCR